MLTLFRNTAFFSRGSSPVRVMYAKPPQALSAAIVVRSGPPGGGGTSCTVLSFQVNLGALLTGLGSGALLDPDKSVLGQTVRRSQQYPGLLSDVQLLQHESLALREQLRAAEQQFHALQESSGGAMAQSPWHEHYASALAFACTSHATELQNLKSEHASTLSTRQQSHMMALQALSDKMKSAHEDERKRVALEHVAARRSEDAQLRSHMQGEYDCKLVLESRKWFTAVQGDPLHAVHQVPKYDDLTVGGQAQEKC